MLTLVEVNLSKGGHPSVAGDSKELTLAAGLHSMVAARWLGALQCQTSHS